MPTQYLTSHLTPYELISLLTPLDRLVSLNLTVPGMFHPEDRIPLEEILDPLPTFETFGSQRGRHHSA